MHHKLSITDLPIKGKKVLLRVDFNVPFDKEGKISDMTRIEASLPSIRYLLDRGGAVIIMSHLGRPKGKKTPEYSLAPVAKALETLLHRPVIMASDCVGPEVEKQAAALLPGEVLLLENLRFHPEEEHPEKGGEFSEGLARLADYYVDDAFGCAHRPHASIYTVPHLFADRAAAGFLMEREIEFFEPLLFGPERPFYAIIGGAKISTKIGILKALLRKVDGILIGGAMAYTFLKAKGIPIGNSLYEEELVHEAKAILSEAEHIKVKVLLPLDHLVAERVAEGVRGEVVDREIPAGFSGVDIGPKTIDCYIDMLKKAKTVFWNGPMGVFEIPAFSKGTLAIAKCLTTLEATTIVGGGDSVAAVHLLEDTGKISHISTGGGAALELIEFGTLPGIEALSAPERHTINHDHIIL